METNQTQPEVMMPIKPQEEHRWLQKLVGEWSYETEIMMEPAQPPKKLQRENMCDRLVNFGLWLKEGVRCPVVAWRQR